MRRRFSRLSLAIFLVALAAGLPAVAQARVSVDVGIGPRFGPHYYAPRYYAPHYYAPHYYIPPPVYYYPPPVVYAPPPPVVYTPPPVVVQSPPAAAAGAQCREYHGNATIDRRAQPFYGTACLQPDGKWHIVN